MPTARSVLSLTCALLAASCDGGGSTPADAASPVDAGAADAARFVDAGSTDAGPRPTDAGPRPTDAGPRPTDAGASACPAPTGIMPVSTMAHGTPAFDLVGPVLFAGPMGSRADDFAPARATVALVLAPRHMVSGPTITPYERHSPPYASELADGVTRAGFVSRSCFTSSQFTAPSGLHLLVQLVPNALAPTGTSADFVSGPVLPDATYFIDADLLRDGVIFDREFDSSLRLPVLPGPSHSHQPLVFSENMEFAPAGVTAPGHYTLMLWVGNSPGILPDSIGWLVTYEFDIIADAP